MTEEELKHYGVLGMRWGIKRATTKEALGKVSGKISAKTTKLQGKIAKAETKNVKYQGKKAKYQERLLKNIGTKKTKKIEKAAKKLNKFNKKAVKNIKKIDKMKKLIIKHDILLDTLNKKMSQLPPAAIKKGKLIVEGSTKRGVKK